MTINFFEPDAVPQPPDKVKIELLESSVYEDRWRVRVALHVTPFQVRPNLAIALLTDNDDTALVSELSVIETMHAKMEFTMHIRGVPDPAGNYILKARLYYGEDILKPFDQKSHLFSIPRLEGHDAR